MCYVLNPSENAVFISIRRAKNNIKRTIFAKSNVYIKLHHKGNLFVCLLWCRTIITGIKYDWPS